MTPPVPPRGLQGKGAALVSNAINLLREAIATPGMGAETEIGQAVLKSLTMLGKALPDGTVTPGQENAGMQQFMLQARQQNPIQSIIAALGQGGGGGAPGGAPTPPPAPPQM